MTFCASSYDIVVEEAIREASSQDISVVVGAAGAAVAGAGAGFGAGAGS